MSGIFISYRRGDSRGSAGRLYDDLTDRFGSDQVFRDLDAIEPGADYSERIEDFIRSCDVLVAVIGSQWSDIRDEQGHRRLDDPQDFVRREIVSAMQAGKVVIPVLVEDALMPEPSAVPAAMVPLSHRNALPLSDARWRYDVGVLCKRLEKVVASAGTIAGTPAVEATSTQDVAGPGADAGRRATWSAWLRRRRWQGGVVLVLVLLVGAALVARAVRQPGVAQGTAGLRDPRGLAIDAAGDVYVADYAQHRVLRVTPDGGVTTVAGTGRAESAGDGGPATSASVESPGALAFDAVGNLFIAETDRGIRRVAPDGRISSVTIVAPGVNEIRPSAIAIAPDGSILVATTREVLRIGTDGRLMPVAGSATSGFGGDSGPATSAKLDSPNALAVAGDGSIYIADSGNNRVRKVGVDGTIVTVAGTGSSNTSAREGELAVEIAVPAPSGIVAERDGGLYVSSSNQVGRIGPDGRITRLAGDPDDTAGFSGDGGPALSARMDDLVALARDGRGNLYVSDSGNNRVRKITPEGVITTVA